MSHNGMGFHPCAIHFIRRSGLDPWFLDTKDHVQAMGWLVPHGSDPTLLKQQPSSSRTPNPLWIVNSLPCDSPRRILSVNWREVQFRIEQYNCELATQFTDGSDIAVGSLKPVGIEVVSTCYQHTVADNERCALRVRR